MRKREESLEFVRAAAMLAVILLHTNSLFIWTESSRTVLGMNAAFLVNQLARFSVPVFVMLSGAALARRDAPSDPAAFIVRRLRRLLPPYAVWTAVYTLFNGERLFSRRFLHNLLTGGATAHLWFIPLMVQCAVCYPFLRFCADRDLLSTLAVTFSAAFASQILIHYQTVLPAPKYLWMSLPAWAFFYVCGMALPPERLANLRVWAGKRLWIVLGAAAVCGFFNALEGRTLGVTDSLRPSLTGYAFCAFAALLGVWERYGHALRRPALFLARHSMTIYYSHVLILESLLRTHRFRGTSGAAVLCVLVTGLSVPASALIDRGVSRIPKLPKRKR